MPDFEIQVLYNNVLHLAKLRGKRLGELEEKAGVSAGYLSRLVKSDPPSKVPVGVVMTFADELGVSVDVLVRHDLTALSPAEGQVALFLEKLVADTKTGAICWDKFSGDTVDQDTEVYPDNTTSNPLMAFRYKKLVYLSAFGPNDECHPAGDFFATDINNGKTRAFLFQVKHPQTEVYDYEFYVYPNDTYSTSEVKAEPVCGTDPRTPSPLDKFLARLYEAASMGTQNIRFSPKVQAIISEYLGTDGSEGRS